MVNGMRCVGSVEKAPELLISHKKPSSCPRLETIVEEGCERFEVGRMRVLFVLPVFLSVVSYIVLCRRINNVKC
ncbi:hypothetical protein SLA2020_326810 [Shorea laevis]